jgi:hypothetical protein
MLIIGFESEPDVIDRLRRLVPTSKVVDHPRHVNQAEYDVLVTDRFESPWPMPGLFDQRGRRIAGHLSVIYRSDGSSRVFEGIRDAAGVRAGRFAYQDSVDRPLARLVKAQLALARARDEAGKTHRFFEATDAFARVPAGIALQVPQPRALHPFLQTEEGQVLAGWYKRSETAEGWLLPSDVENLPAWVASALDHLHERDPDRFPRRPSWKDEWRWQTPDEQRLSEAIRTVEAHRQAILDDLDSTERALRAEQADARAAADAYERAWLTLQGDELVAVAATALRELGFDVVEVDATVVPGQPLLEDLQVTDPESPAWMALVEVRGYTSGAKSNDLGRIRRFVDHYTAENGQTPPARWYLVNHTIGTDPSLRPGMLEGAEKDTKMFASEGGLAWDTSQLFSLMVSVRSGIASSAEVRALLRDSAGRLSVPAAWEPAHRPSPDPASTTAGAPPAGTGPGD